MTNAYCTYSYGGVSFFFRSKHIVGVEDARGVAAPGPGDGISVVTVCGIKLSMAEVEVVAGGVWWGEWEWGPFGGVV